MSTYKSTETWSKFKEIVGMCKQYFTLTYIPRPAETASDDDERTARRLCWVFVDGGWWIVDGD